MEILNKVHGKTENSYETTKENYTSNLSELEKVKRELESTKGILKIVEIQHTEYVTRLRAENRKLIARHEHETRNMEMSFEDIRSLLGKINIK